MNDRALTAHCAASLREDIAERKAEIQHMERILIERDEALKYSWDNREDGTGQGPIWPMCGCRPRVYCGWHEHVRVELEGAEAV